jgi:PIN domain nuclease of toxin-antitoxin system
VFYEPASASIKAFVNQAKISEQKIDAKMYAKLRYLKRASKNPSARA